MNESKKYSRSLHAHISLGATSDDRFMPTGYVAAFADMDKLVITEKLDGQNNCLSKYGVFARSHAAPSLHPWDKPLVDRWQLIKRSLGDLEVFGENMYGIHSIAYRKLESYFYVFAIREGEVWLSWEEVKFYAALLELPVVPEIAVQSQLTTFVERHNDENKALENFLTANLKMKWEESINTSGCLGGYDPTTGEECSEGFVVRNASAYLTNQGSIKVAPNEFNNLFKIVRKDHVKTDTHWTKQWKPAQLANYEKYNWHTYSYLGHQ